MTRFLSLVATLVVAISVAPVTGAQNLNPPVPPAQDPDWAPPNQATDGQLAYYADPDHPEQHSPLRGASSRFDVVTNEGAGDYTYHFSEWYQLDLDGQTIEIEIYQPLELIFSLPPWVDNFGCAAALRLRDPLVAGESTGLLTLENHPGWHTYQVLLPDSTAVEGWLSYWFLKGDNQHQDECWLMAEITGWGQVFAPDAFPVGTEPTVDGPGHHTPHDARVYPNPARQQVTLEVTLEQPELVDIGLYDLTGRQVYSYQEYRPAGMSAIRLDLPARLATGAYLLCYRAGEVSGTKVITVVR